MCPKTTNQNTSSDICVHHVINIVIASIIISTKCLVIYQQWLLDTMQHHNKTNYQVMVIDLYEQNTTDQ